MDFFKNLFSKDEPFVPTPTQHVPELKPIVVQAIENLYPRKADQKKVFKYSIKYIEANRENTLALLSILNYSQGKIENLVDLDSPDLYLIVYHIMVDYGFPNMKTAEQWVQSITKSQH